MDKIFALLTDFGLADPYVAQVKSKLITHCCNCSIIDISHAVRPQNILQAAFFLEATWAYLPSNCICLAIVDPGVGTDRKIVLLQTKDKAVLAPDNGLLSLVLQKIKDPYLLSIQPGQINDQASSTFHARDIFAPLACALAKGELPKELGTPVGIEELVTLSRSRPQRQGANICASILHIDQFGNCILNLESDQWSTKIRSSNNISLISPQVADITPAKTYSDLAAEKIGILEGSQGYLELALNQNSCARRLGLDVGDECIFSVSGR